MSISAEKQRQRYAEDPEYREHKKTLSREYMRRRLTDPEFREQHNQTTRVWHNKKYAEDPDYRERKKAGARAYHARMRAQRSVA